jgi:hypothetical protein
MAEDSIFAVREISKQYERTSDVDDQLRLCAPQAMLRDLHRPSKEFTVSLMDFERHEMRLDGGREAAAATKRLMTASYRIPIMELVPTRAMYHQAWGELRGILTGPWTDAPKFGTQYVPKWKQGITW